MSPQEEAQVLRGLEVHDEGDEVVGHLVLAVQRHHVDLVARRELEGLHHHSVLGSFLISIAVKMITRGSELNWISRDK